ncbi:MAG: non-canonical purine NTP pyrophosphatase [Rhodobacteraceae bacterium]|nr:non-canonical purine NTP pyrophosphatase [Paracoccaceae bacterium]
MRQLTEKSVVLATHNSGKLQEFRELLAPFGKLVIPAREFGLDEPAETEASFAGNARIKAAHAARSTGVPSLADDSGIEVDALAGQPGIHTADWAETPGGRDFRIMMDRTWRMLGDAGAPEPWSARFRCSLCIAWPDGHDTSFEGSVAGRFVWPMRGGNGFGFDPIFQPDGHNLTFGEMDPGQKQGMSPRTAAFAKFVDTCLRDA